MNQLRTVLRGFYTELASVKLLADRMETVSESWQVPSNKKTFGMLLMLLLGLLAPWSGFMF